MMTECNEKTDVGNSPSTSRSKVVSILERYELHGLGDELVERWTQNTPDYMSLRELAKFVNESLIEAAIDEADGQPLDGEAANYYRLLTSEDVSSGTRIEAVNELNQRGVDVDQLESDFVSRQAIHTYLTKVRDVSPHSEKRPAAERIDDRLQSIQRLKTRLGTVVERVLTELDNAELITVGTTRITVLVRVECDDCDSQFHVTELLRNEGCNCGHVDGIRNEN